MSKKKSGKAAVTRQGVRDLNNIRSDRTNIRRLPKIPEGQFSDEIFELMASYEEHS